MANTKTPDLTTLSSLANEDLLYVVDVSDTSQSVDGSSKKVAYSNIRLGLASSGANSDITSLTALSTPLSVAQGGSGAATLTGIVKGNGTSAFTVVTAPSGTIVGTSDSQTLTNKTLTSPAINSATITTPAMIGAYEAWVTDSDGATITFNLATGNKHRVTLAGNRTLALSNVQNGHGFVIKLTQDGTGSRTVTWFAGITWGNGGTVPTLTTTASKSDVFGFFQTGSNTYDGYILTQNL